MKSTLQVYNNCCLDEPPAITSHPKSLKQISDKPVTFTVQATGTEPLKYNWEWKPAMKDASKEWRSCDSEWSNGATLTIPKVEKSNEGYYRCVVSNCPGSQTSNPATLSVGKNEKSIILSVSISNSLSCFYMLIVEPPRITTHPQELKDVVQGKPAKFSIQATGTEPLSYHWEWKPVEEDGGGSEEWQPCDPEWCDGATYCNPQCAEV